MVGARQLNRVSEHECAAIRQLANGGYTYSMLSLMFEYKEGTIGRHINGECDHSAGPTVRACGEDDDPSRDRLVTAYVAVASANGRASLTAQEYQELKPTHFPEPKQFTPAGPFQTWGEVTVAAIQQRQEVEE